MILEEFAVAHWTPNVLERTVLRRALRNRPDAIDAFCKSLLRLVNKHLNSPLCRHCAVQATRTRGSLQTYAESNDENEA